jgi:hypothetical protein
LLVRKLGYFGAFARGLDRDGANLAVLVQISSRSLVSATSAARNFDVKRIGILKVFYFHGRNSPIEKCIMNGSLIRKQYDSVEKEYFISGCSIRLFEDVPQLPIKKKSSGYPILSDT